MPTQEVESHQTAHALKPLEIVNFAFPLYFFLACMLVAIVLKLGGYGVQRLTKDRMQAARL